MLRLWHAEEFSVLVSRSSGMLWCCRVWFAQLRSVQRGLCFSVAARGRYARSKSCVPPAVVLHGDPVETATVSGASSEQSSLECVRAWLSVFALPCCCAYVALGCLTLFSYGAHPFADSSTHVGRAEFMT